MQTPQNSYVHIPFCKSKCNYCSFTSTCNLNLKEDYINTLIEEIKANYAYSPLKTLYFGGGTPSLLMIRELEKVFFLFNTNENTEVTYEANPESLTLDYLICLKNIGINRLSIGAQTFNDKTLENIGRIHNSSDIFKAIEFAQKAGFENISIDLMYGLPEQTREDFTDNLNLALKLDIQHISLYGLKIDEPCKFYRNMPKSLPDNDIQADMYIDAVNILAQNGFEHYEISNFAKHGFYSQHNLNYWNNNTYFAFGAAAHGYINGIRYSNTVNIDKYIKNPLLERYEHEVTQQEQLEEEIFLGFRKIEGINVDNINKKYSVDFETKYAKVLDKYKKSGHILQTENGYKLSIEGLLLSTNILSEFLA